ncbi:MAG TPA: hypothetical protein VFU49_21155, partial [Ktedonobacteraceae bacterium]|nr:hypothetical protein [Ktedonobacteraceae bacterium]
MAKKRFLFSPKKATIWRLFDIVGKTSLFVGILLIQAALSGYASPSVLPAIGAASGMATYMGGNSRINYEATETLLN